MELHLAHTQGFCAGVAVAIDAVELAIEKYGIPLYVRHHIVHNTAVIEDFEARGVVFIETLSEVPEGQSVIFSAHGTAPDVFKEAKKKNLHIIDATCPLVTKVHRAALRYSKRNVQTVLIGHHGHQELVGTSGYIKDELRFIVETEEDVDKLKVDPNKEIGYLTQTTLSVTETQGIINKLKLKYPHIQGPKKADICFATTNRQNAVVELADFCEVIIICGSPNSSNSNRLKETAIEKGVEGYIIDKAQEFKPEWIQGKKVVGISSGASVPKFIVDQLVKKIKEIIPTVSIHEKETIEKGINFKIPNI